MIGAPLVVLAADADAAARAFVAQHASARAVLVTPRDLSRPGWALRLSDPRETRLQIDGAPIRAEEVGGVLTRLPAVTEWELPHITAQDRAYVAAEMTAFLLSLLSGLPVPVINRPTTQCLCGPLWSEAMWRRTAAHAGLRAAVLRRRVALGSEPASPVSGMAVAVVGEAAFGAVDQAQAEVARRLAHVAGADLLTVFLDKQPPYDVVHAQPFVDLEDPQIAAEVLTLFTRRAELWLR